MVTLLNVDGLLGNLAVGLGPGGFEVALGLDGRDGNTCKACRLGGGDGAGEVARDGGKEVEAGWNGSAVTLSRE